MTDFSHQLQTLVETGAFARVLFACHRPCRWLISFEDFCQEILVRSLEHQHSFRGQTTAELAGWVRAIGRQLMINLLRRSREQRQLSLQLELVDPQAIPPSEQIAAAEDWNRKLSWLMQVLRELPTEERDLLIRHYYRRETFADIARQLGVPPNTIVQRHLRLLERLRRMRRD